MYVLLNYAKPELNCFNGLNNAKSEKNYAVKQIAIKLFFNFRLIGY